MFCVIWKFESKNSNPLLTWGFEPMFYLVEVSGFEPARVPTRGCSNGDTRRPDR